MKTKTHGELKNGDVVCVQGYWFEVVNLRIAALAGDQRGVHQEPYPADVIRYDGYCVENCDIAGTSYNGGTYGAYAWVPIAVR